jgi:hypothetical protein
LFKIFDKKYPGGKIRESISQKIWGKNSRRQPTRQKYQEKIFGKNIGQQIFRNYILQDIRKKYTAKNIQQKSSKKIGKNICKNKYRKIK